MSEGLQVAGFIIGLLLSLRWVVHRKHWARWFGLLLQVMLLAAGLLFARAPNEMIGAHVTAAIIGAFIVIAKERPEWIDKAIE
jgi:drug/metabolite transporter superfamily protein YnfA